MATTTNPVVKEQLDERIGTTPCEYAAACTRETNWIVQFPWGWIPCCESHIRFMERL